MKYLAVLGRQPKISLAELEALFENVKPLGNELAVIETTKIPDINRLGGSLKLAEELDGQPIDYLRNLPEGKITLGISDYSSHATKRSAMNEALKLKKILSRHGRSMRVVPNQTAVISTATSHHNQLGEKTNHVELLLTNKTWWKLIGVQNITAYSKRDQARPARDAKVGMLPPKLAQILINLCGDLKTGSVILDPFCGTGVVLQEAMLMGYRPYGTDISDRMVDYSIKNLGWLTTETAKHRPEKECFTVFVGDATSFKWDKFDAVACEGYLGKPMSLPPAEIKLKAEKQECGTIVLGFLKNLGKQIKSNTPVVMAAPAWLRPNGEYSRLNLLDEIEKLGYNVRKFKNASQKDLLYHRDGQVVARELIVLRKV